MRFYQIKTLMEAGRAMSVKILDNAKLPASSPYGAVGTGDVFLKLLFTKPKEIQDANGNEFKEITSQAGALKLDIDAWEKENNQKITSNKVEFEQMLGRHSITTTLLNKVKKTDAFGSSKKELYKVKPSDIFAGEFDEGDIGDLEKVIAQHAIPGKNLEKTILGSPTLQDPRNPLGQIVTEIVKNMQSGSLKAPKGDWWEAESGKMVKAVRDYAGEYLGVVATVNGLANIPSEGELKKFLGVQDLRDLSFYFPMKSNVPLADSFGYVESATQRMNISSKGGTAGAAPSITALQISSKVRAKKEYAEEVAFIELVQQSSEFGGVFRMYSLLHEIGKEGIEKVPNKPMSITSFSESDISFLKDINSKRTKMSAEQQEKLINSKPNLKTFYQELQKFTKRKVSQPIGFLRYYTQKIVIDAINKYNALPEFQKIVREVLGDNFIQIYTDLKGNKESGGNVSVRIMYPANITEEVKVEVDSGSSQKEMGGRLGFRISPKKF